MSRLAVTRLSDGRLQVWAVYGPHLYSAWQTSTNPAQPWTVPAAFSPTALSGTEIGTSVCAGHSPNGRAQVWVNGTNTATDQSFIRTTWSATEQANSGWLPWSNFPNAVKGDADTLYIAAVGQLKDGRMQLFAIGSGVGNLGYLWTCWKEDVEINSQWTRWGLFNPNPAAVTEFVAAGSRSNGLLQIWAGGGIRSSGSAVSTAPVQSTWQTSSTPSAVWANWQAPFVPQLVSQPLTMQCAAGQLTDGSLQLWALTSDGQLHSTWETSPAPAWANWESPFLPNPGVMNDVAVGRLKDGSAQIFVASRPSASGTVQIMTSRQTKNNPNASPPGWTPWASMGTVQA
jgi:hypothetical protein